MGYLGVDVGSLFVSAVLLDEQGHATREIYRRHNGDPQEAVREALGEIDLDAVRAIVRTGSGGEGLALAGEYVDAVVAGVEGVRRLVPGARNIISIGGGSFSLTRLDEQGDFRRATCNSACASGTGAFLDQQALRLQIDPTELAERAMAYGKRPPGVATRCAVFAKSDMIHLQQEGFTTDAIAAGLCAGLGRSTVDGLLSGHKLEGKTAIIGGVARNKVVVAAVREKLGVACEVPERPEVVGALGAAHVARDHALRQAAAMEAAKAEDAKPEDATRPGVDLAALAADRGEDREEGFLRPPLAMTLSTYPDFTWHTHWVNEDGSEIAIVAPRTGTLAVSLGIDIGSTSTKAVVLDEAKEVVGWIYRKTAGNPIQAVQLLFKAFLEMGQTGGFELDVQGVGTTGSGRKMIGALIGSDLAVNEITAHATAAAFIDPEVDTILELGGQDAKFTQLQNGMVYNSIMNYVCAAGTGSFIEEQALKLGIPLTEYADRVMGKRCPKTSDRCTVYMERDLDILMARGWSREEVAAAVLHSVRDNYLNKVVGGLKIGDHVYFQGATARNKGLVAAFEMELGTPIKVSPFCHVTGALGMALLARDRVAPADRSKAFKGFAFAHEEVTVDYETCELCHNLCNLSLIHAGDTALAWGLKCGRDYGEKKVKQRKVTTYDWWRARDLAWAKPTPARDMDRPKRRVGLLRSLGTYGYYPYWSALLGELGCEVVFSPRSSDKILHQGMEITTAEYCAPVVMSHGHAMELARDESLDYIFVPHMLREPVTKGFTDAHFCAYVQAHPGVLASIEELGVAGKLLAPVVQFNEPERYQIKKLAESLGEPLGVTEKEIGRALAAARQRQADFAAASLEQGRLALKALEERDTLGIVCVGRPYNTVDAGMTLDLPRKIAELGYPVLYMDMLDLDLNAILPEFNNMYWHYGQKILATAERITREKRLFGVYFTNFMCGPDSYIMTYFKEIMGRAGKPYLCLQFDGHGADAGYLTRVEAAFESFHAWSGIPRPARDTVQADAAVTV